MINIKVKGALVQVETEGHLNLKDLKTDTLMALYAIQQTIKDDAESEEQAQEAIRHWKAAVARFILKDEEPTIVKVFESDKPGQTGKISELFDGSLSDFMDSANE